MARTSGRRWKGCQLWKPYKHAGNGDAYRAPFKVRRQTGHGRRWNRHDVD
jgi:hypothetical protein